MQLRSPDVIFVMELVVCLGNILWGFNRDIQSNLYNTTILGTYIKRSSWSGGILKRFFVKKFADVSETNVCRSGKTSCAKMTRSSLVTFWSLSVHIGYDRNHRRQVVVFETLLNTCVPN